MTDILIEPWKPPPVTPAKPDDASREIRAVTSEKTIRANADRLAGVRQGIKEGKRMSLLGKMAHLTESAQDFHKQTEVVLDGIAEKIETATRKRDEATAKHHAYYDTIIKGVDDSVAVIDRLSNGPLHGDGEG